MSAKVYDILGIFAPAVIPSKILQKKWMLKLDWDAPTTEETSTQFRQWIDQLQCISAHPVPRRLVPSDIQVLTQSLHGFADSSQELTELWYISEPSTLTVACRSPS